MVWGRESLLATGIFRVPGSCKPEGENQKAKGKNQRAKIGELANEHDEKWDAARTLRSLAALTCEYNRIDILIRRVIGNHFSTVWTGFAFHVRDENCSSGMSEF